MNCRLTIMSKFARRMCALRLKRPRQPVLERPHCARRTHVRGLARPARSVGQSDDVLLASVRAGDDRNQNAARADQAAKRLARRLDEAVNKDPIEAFPRR